MEISENDYTCKDEDLALKNAYNHMMWVILFWVANRDNLFSMFFFKLSNLITYKLAFKMLRFYLILVISLQPHGVCHLLMIWKYTKFVFNIFLNYQTL